MQEDACFCLFFQDLKATQKQRELDKAKEKQQEQLDKQKQIEKVKWNIWDLYVFECFLKKSLKAAFMWSKTFSEKSNIVK